jgi:dGTPase
MKIMRPRDYSDLIAKIEQRTNDYEKINFKEYATFSKDAIRKPDYGKTTMRPEFCRDADRIIHSLSFARFSDKTQVFFWINSDLFQHRLLHVQLVSKISRYIARIMNLNEDLTEAIALGHDIGHVPFGHDGEMFLSKLCNENGIGEFRHNYESVWFLNEIEMQNLTLQTCDGILCHNGEIHEQVIKPNKKNLSWERLEEEMHDVIFNPKNLKDPTPKPKTMEGALVRFVDVISYISRDIRDAEHLGMVFFKDLPNNVKSTLGNTNRGIINTLINDLVNNSLDKDSISYSLDVSNALQELYKFNLDNIYTHPKKKKAYDFISSAFNILWNRFLNDYENDDRNSEIFYDHFDYNLSDIKSRYPEISDLEKYPYYKKNIKNGKIVVRDFLAGCTDGYFLSLVQKYAPELEFKKEDVVNIQKK